MNVRLLLSILIICGLVACSKAPTPLTKAQVLETIQAYDTAWSQQDTATVAKLLADSYVYFSSTGDVTTRKYILENLLGNPTYNIDSKRSELQVQIYGNTAIVGSRWQGTGTYEGEPVRDDQRCSLVLMKLNSRLQIVSEHCTQIADS